MRRRLLTGFVLLDGLCALLAPVAASAMADVPEPATVLEINGMCVEEVRSAPDAVAWKAVPMARCSGS